MEEYAIYQSFFVYNILLVLIFAAITLVVSIFSWKIYKLTKERQIKLLGLSFMCISAAYFLRVIVQLLLMTKLDDFAMMPRGEIMRYVMPIDMIVTNGFMVFFLLGLVILCYMVLKIKDMKLFVLLAGAITISMVFTPRQLLTFHLVSAFLLGFIVFEYYKNYKKSHKSHSLLVFCAFTSLFLAQLFLIYSVVRADFFVAGRVLEFVAYLLILINLIMVYRAK